MFGNVNEQKDFCWLVRVVSSRSMQYSISGNPRIPKPAYSVFLDTSCFLFYFLLKMYIYILNRELGN